MSKPNREEVPSTPNTKKTTNVAKIEIPKIEDSSFKPLIITAFCLFKLIKEIQRYILIAYYYLCTFTFRKQMSNSLKKRTAQAIFWSFIDKGAQQLIQLVFGVVLAHILLPSDMGVFALLAIFTVVANILQESGFSSALIRKKNPSEEDYASVFYFNISISILVYTILYFTTPYIANFYDKPILEPLAKVAFLAFLFNSFGLIQNVQLIRRMDFKTNTRITLIASSIAGIVAITMALQGYGVWSLALQLVVQCLLRSFLLWIYVKWRPKAGFSLFHIKNMASYSAKLLATSLMNQICGNIYSNIIGKLFNDHQTGVYSYANKYSVLPQTVISDGIRTAAFPALTQIEDDLGYTKKAFRKVVRITAFVSFPVALLIIVVAKPLIILLITDKWADSIPLLQILAIGGAFYPLYSLVGTLLQTLGKTGAILRLEMFRNILTLSLIFVTINFGVIGLVSGASLVSIIAFTVGIIYAGTMIKYNFIEIAKDTIPYLLISSISIIPFTFLQHFGISNLYALLFIPTITGLILYLVILKVAGAVILDESIAFLRQLINNTRDND